MALAMVCTLCNCMQHTVIFVVTPVQACVDVSGFMTACFISSCKLLVRLGNCTEGFAQIVLHCAFYTCFSSNSISVIAKYGLALELSCLAGRKTCDNSIVHV